MVSLNVFSLLFLLGICTLFPYNCLLNSSPYMDYVMFPGHGWSLKITPIYSTANVVIQLLLMIASRMQTCSSMTMISIACFITAGSGGLLLLSCATELASEWIRYYFAFAACIALGCCCGALNSACGSLGGSLISRYGSNLVNMHGSGITLAGLLASGIALPLETFISKAFGSLTLFWITVFLSSLCIGGVIFLSQSGALKPSHQGQGNELSIEVSDINVSDAAARETSTPAEAPSIFSSISRNWQQEVNLFIMFVQTFVVFPGVMLQWKPNGFIQGSFVVVMISSFQVGEVAGRFCFPLLLKISPQGRYVWRLVLLRFSLWLPIFLAWQQPDGIFDHYACELLSMALLGWSQGYLTSLMFMRGMTECWPKDVDTLGRLLPFVLNVGILAGSYLSDYIVARSA